jgi:hypothetical protein
MDWARGAREERKALQLGSKQGELKFSDCMNKGVTQSPQRLFCIVSRLCGVAAGFRHGPSVQLDEGLVSCGWERARSVRRGQW